MHARQDGAMAHVARNSAPPPAPPVVQARRPPARPSIPVQALRAQGRVPIQVPVVTARARRTQVSVVTAARVAVAPSTPLPARRYEMAAPARLIVHAVPRS